MRTVCDGGVLVPILVGVLLTPQTTRGDDFAWTGNGGLAFHDPANWSSAGGGVPGAADRGIFALDETIDVWLDFEPDQDRIDQVRVEAGTVALRILTQGDHFQMLGGGVLRPALQVVAAEHAVTTLSLENLSSPAERTIQIGEILLGELDNAPGGTVLLRSPAQQSQLDIDVARGVTIGVGAMDASITLGRSRRLTTTDITIAAGDPAAHGTLALDMAETFATGLLRVGALGTGQVDVLDGSRLECGELQLGSALEATGTLTVSGADSEVRVESFCDIGYHGVGAVTVSDAGRFTALDDVFVGFSATYLPDTTVIPSSGRITVDGANAEFLALEDLWLGLAGEGSMHSMHGGRIRINGALHSVDVPGFDVNVVLSAPDDDGPIIDVDGPVAALSYAIALEVGAEFDGRETWTLIRSGATLSAPVAVSIDAGVGAWRPVASVLSDRIDVSLVARADLDASGAVDFNDMLIVLGAWGICLESSCLADLDGNDLVDLNDLILLLANWSVL